MSKKSQQYDVIIIGGGVSGSALLYALSRYSDLKNICLIEKESDVALINSHGRNNSQTLHCGDIETNYTLEKAVEVKMAAQALVRYAEKLPDKEKILFKFPKMVLGVGEQEVALLDERFERFSPHFPAMEKIGKEEISKIEPNVVAGRKQDILALAMRDQYCAVNFQELARSFIAGSKHGPQKPTVLFNTKVSRIIQEENSATVIADGRRLQARFLVVSAGGHSLMFAQSLDYGKEYACLPVAGSFYYAPEALKGKVYTVQNDKLPFAAIHGDPDLLAPGKTRFGPTALVLPVLERYHWNTFFDFMKIVSLSPAALSVVGQLFTDPVRRNYMIRNMLYEVPVLRRHLFVKDAQKIVPKIKATDLQFASRIGGIRPVLIDKNERKLHLGEAKIRPVKHIVFNMTPSPGATSCLYNAIKDFQLIAQELGCQFPAAQIASELGIELS